MTRFQRPLGTIVGLTALLATAGCEQAAAPNVTRAATVDATSTAANLDITPTTTFAEVNQLSPEFVEELMSLQPIRGRDRNFRFSQPIFAQPAAMPVIFHRLIDLEESQINRVALASALRTNRGPWQELALELLGTEEDASVRMGLMRSLEKSQPDVLSKAIVLGLTDTDARVRDWAAQGAVQLFANHEGAGATEDLKASLVERLGDADAGVRATTVRALSFTGQVAYIDAMAKLLSDDDGLTRLAAIDALVRLDAGEAKRRVDAAQLVGDADPRVARAASRL